MAIYLGNLELATGGGGGGELPVNSYAPFLVGGGGNPLGYDATTGLYTHPDGTYWLRSGFTISGPTVGATYPDAYQVSTVPTGATYTGFSFATGANPAGIVGFGGKFYVNRKTSSTSGLLVEYDSAGVATGFSFATPNKQGVYYDGTNYVFNGPSNANQYNSAGVATGFTFAAGQSGDYGITGSGSHYYVAQIQTVREFDLAGNATGFTFTAPAGIVDGLSFDGSFFWTTREVGETVFCSNPDGTNTGFTFSTAAQAPDPCGIWSSGTHVYVADNNLDRVYEYQLTGADKRIGDVTARTDADTGKPLFVRVK